MSQLQELVLTAFVTIFMSVFMLVWLWQSGPIAPQLAKTYRAIIRFGAKTKVPTLCAGHAVELITMKNRMAILNNKECEICTKRSKLV